MKAFWWFKENSIAGMARPGFNCTRWFEFTFEEAILVGWFGQHATGFVSRESLEKHMNHYVPKLAKFYDLTADQVQNSIDLVRSTSGLLRILNQLKKKTKILEGFDVTENQVYFGFCSERLDQEIQFLKGKDIETIVTLTEQHHNKNVLEKHFDVHHFSINDLTAPQMDQVHKLAEVIQESRINNRKMAVHCLAGLGRTSTMLMSSHLLLGEKLEDLKTRVTLKNPSFVMIGSQAEFVHSVANRKSN